MNTQVSYAMQSTSTTQQGGLSSKENLCEVLEGNLKTKSEIGVILPTYCEVANIKKLIDKIENLNMNASVLVIDDSSPDGTANIVRSLQRKYRNVLLFVRPKKSGLGTAITDGFKIFLSLENPPKYIVTMDADYSHSPEEVPYLTAPLERGCDLVIGSRYTLGGKTVDWGIVRSVISKMANLLAALVIGAKICDYTSGMRCYSANLVRNIVNDLHSQTYEIQIETIRQAHLRGFRIKEVPITFVNRKKGKSKLTSNEIRGFVSHLLKSLLLNRRIN